MIKVLHVTYDMRIGGTEMVIKNIIDGNSDRSIAMSIFCIEEPLGPWGEELKKAGTDISTAHRQPGFDTSLIKSLRRHIERYDIDVVHCHQYTPWVYGTLAALFTKAKVIFTEHGRFYPDSTSWKRQLVNPVLMRATKKATAISHATKDALEEYEFIPKARIDVIYNGIKSLQVDNTIKAVTKSELAIPEESIVLGTIARFDPIKNQEMMIKAFSAALKENQNLVLVLVGDGEMRPTLEALVQKEGIEDHVRFTGYIKDPSRYLAIMDIFLLSSLSEGTSMTLLEAMSLSKPCIVTDAGGNSEIVEHQQTGLVTENANQKAYTSAINTLCSSPMSIKEMGANGYSVFCQKFNAKNMVAQYAHLYREITGR